jgi:hypothetical protein
VRTSRADEPVSMMADKVADKAAVTRVILRTPNVRLRMS